MGSRIGDCAVITLLGAISAVSIVAASVGSHLWGQVAGRKTLLGKSTR